MIVRNEIPILECDDKSLEVIAPYISSQMRIVIILNLSNFDTSNATSMSDMFSSCTSLTSLERLFRRYLRHQQILYSR